MKRVLKAAGWALLSVVWTYLFWVSIHDVSTPPGPPYARPGIWEDERR